MVRTIFLDADGVMINFVSAAANLVGVDVRDTINRTHLKTEKLTKLVGSNKMWSAIDRAGVDFWANLKPLPWAGELIAWAQSKGVVSICTKNSNDATSAMGKMLCIQKHFPRLDYILTNQKAHCAGPNKFLVDDTYKQVMGWRNAGGNSYLWPNQFALEDGDIKLTDVFQQLDMELKL